MKNKTPEEEMVQDLPEVPDDEPEGIITVNPDGTLKYSGPKYENGRRYRQDKTK